jgi:endonuclease G
VVTGPVLRDGLPKIQQGSYRVSIPEYFYKVVIDTEGKELRGIGFIFPNAKASHRIIDYAVTIDSIEALTGIDFFPALDDETEVLIEGPETINRWPVSGIAVAGDPVPVKMSEGQITAGQAKYFVGEETTVCGTAVSTKFNENGKANPTYINIDKKFPDHEFTVVIFGKNRVNFSYEPEKYLFNRKVCITGTVEEWKGIPQMIIDHERAIVVLED